MARLLPRPIDPPVNVTIMLPITLILVLINAVSIHRDYLKCDNCCSFQAGAHTQQERFQAISAVLILTGWVDMMYEVAEQTCPLLDSPQVASNHQP
ncbi:hypothetical protein CTA1_11604 [Colletotrichum tanaceti]|uniref:Uncharacterized protein n=1 Tax=Colletotrichum tanaceti TaxID=1306861 RepID=A0A4U6XT13_9PEZI|nr:hypothetical protein CTA1_11604 [Colletotrichum tanaceti]